MKKTMILLTLVACASSPRENPSGVRKTVQDANDKLETLYAHGEIDELAGYFAVDAWQMPPNQPALVGREAIRQFWTQAVKWGRWDFSLDAQSVDASGILAVERGKYVVKFTANSTSPLPSFMDHGNYVVHWRRDPDGRWRIVADAPVSEVPPPGK